MTGIDSALAAHRNAVGDLVRAAERSAGTWTIPRAPGKWSPAQVVEHVARALEESAHVVAGAPSKFPTLPPFLRPLARAMFFNRVLSKNAFPNAKTGKAFDPASGPGTPAAARVRLEAAREAFDQACRDRAASGKKVESTIFGTVSVEDYARFQELHARHHCSQMPAAM